MNISFLTRFTSLCLVAGFFYSCASLQPNIDELVEENRYNQALEQLDERLENNPDQPELYIQRAEIQALLAKDTQPEQRSNYYAQTADDFELALEYGASEEQEETIDSLRQQFWKDEHNAGLQASENDSGEKQYERAVDHFTNAVILRPDAVSSYKNLAVAQYHLGKIDAGIESLLTALNYSDDNPVSVYENLGYLYLEKGDAEEAAHYYELANKNLDNNLNIAFGLVNAYVASGNSEKAVDLLEGLIENNPQNANLLNVYGTQLYSVTAGVIEELITAYTESDSLLVEQLKVEAESMGEQAEVQLTDAFRRDTLNTEYLESLAVFYNNLAGQYFSLLDVAWESDRDEFRNKALTLVDFAIEYYEKLVELHPEDEEYSSKLNMLRNLKQNRSTTE